MHCNYPVSYCICNTFSQLLDFVATRIPPHSSMVATAGWRQLVKKSFSFHACSDKTTLQSALAHKEDHGLLLTSQTAEQVSFIINVLILHAGLSMMMQIMTIFNQLLFQTVQVYLKLDIPCLCGFLHCSMMYSTVEIWMEQ